MRIEPPPSPPVPSVTRPAATAAAEPPDEPPGVCAMSHGLSVAPFSFVYVRLTPPNSLDVVRPTSTAPAARRRCTIVASWVATRSRKHERRLRLRPARDGGQLLDADRYAAERERHICRRRGSARFVGGDMRERVALGRVDRGEGRLELRARVVFTRTVRVDERTRVATPR